MVKDLCPLANLKTFDLVLGQDPWFGGKGFDSQPTKK